ncbi:MAG TPA: hypothetical protein VEO54_31485 [Thermoanaerobaculia bacterium]|nr:hypothetical protein [Thermoanaerobaculia bacterium]
MTLTVLSLLSLLLFTIHITDDIVRGGDSWGPHSLFGVLMLTVWLYGALVLPERRSGLIIMLLGGIMAAGMPVVHMRWNHPKSSGAFLFLWTLWAIGATGSVSLILAARGLLERKIMPAVANENPDRRG